MAPRPGAYPAWACRPVRHGNVVPLSGTGAHIGDTARAYLYATFTVSYATSTLDISRGTVLTGVIIFGLIVIALQPAYGALSDRSQWVAGRLMIGDPVHPQSSDPQ